MPFKSDLQTLSIFQIPYSKTKDFGYIKYFKAQTTKFVGFSRIQKRVPEHAPKN